MDELRDQQEEAEDYLFDNTGAIYSDDEHTDASYYNSYLNPILGSWSVEASSSDNTEYTQDKKWNKNISKRVQTPYKLAAYRPEAAYCLNYNTDEHDQDVQY